MHGWMSAKSVGRLTSTDTSRVNHNNMCCMRENWKQNPFNPNRIFFILTVFNIAMKKMHECLESDAWQIKLKNARVRQTPVRQTHGKRVDPQSSTLHRSTLLSNVRWTHGHWRVKTAAVVLWPRHLFSTLPMALNSRRDYLGSVTACFKQARFPFGLCRKFELASVNYVKAYVK